MVRFSFPVDFCFKTEILCSVSSTAVTLKPSFANAMLYLPVPAPISKMDFAETFFAYSLIYFKVVIYSTLPD